MSKIKIAVRGNKMALLGSVDLIAGTVGQTLQFYFDEEWTSLKKKIAFKLGTTVLGVYDMDSNEFKIPQSVLSAAGLPLEIGITGYSDDKSIITPTSWCLIGCVKNGSSTGGVTSGGGGGQDDDNKHIIYDGGVIV